MKWVRLDWLVGEKVGLVGQGNCGWFFLEM